jgi:glycosyltransferase involved in cell wall biosynthesis
VQTIIIILNRLVVGGTAMNTLHLIRALKKEYRIVLITGSKEQDELDLQYLSGFLDGVEHIRVPSLKRSINLFADAAAFFKLKQLIKKYRPQLLQTIGAKPGFLGRLAAWRLNVPVIIHAYHGHVFHSYFHPLISKAIIRLERFAASKSTCIITVSAMQKHELAAVYKIAPAEKIKHIPIGIETERFNDIDGALRRAFRQKYLLEENEIAIGIIGRIVPVKNHLFFLELVKSFETMTGRGIKFFIVGDGESMRKKLEEKAAKLKLDFTYFPSNPRSAFLCFTSWITGIETAVNGLDIIVLSSHNEGTPVSLIEAQAAEKPVVAANVGAVEETMQAGVSGYICPPSAIESFSEALQHLIKDASLRRRMGQSGKTFVQTRYTLSRQVSATIALYKTLLEKS